MLAGLAGVLLPVLAHLLSRKRYDTVDWGAMQFLELDPSARRNLRLEDLLLLLVRMLLIALLAIALARPWFNGSWLGRWASTTSRDVVIIIDGSYSMGWEGPLGTPQAAAVRLARQFVNDLRSGDTVMLLDAREQPRMALTGPTRDRVRIRQALDDLPAPGGTANLHEAITKAVQILATGTNVQRELFVLTDYQALSWQPDDDTLWARLDDLKAQSTVPPRIWVMDAAGGELGKASNFTIERLQVSRELAVPGVPIRFSSKVRYRGGDAAIARSVIVEVNGQRLADQTLRLNLAPDGEASVEFERQFHEPGSHLISVILDSDVLPGDNRSDAVIVVAESLPVVLVDGDKKLDPTRSETFFARAALAATGDDVSWIKPSVVTPDALNADTLRNAAVIVLANVAALTEQQQALLERSVASGRGLLFTLGDKTPKNGFALDPDSPFALLFPVRLDEIASDSEADSVGIRVAGSSLELPWLRQFRADKGGTLTDARFPQWWKVKEVRPVPATKSELLEEENTKPSKTPEVTVGTPLVIAKLSNGAPWIVTRRYERGMTAVLTSTIDADWNTLPAKTDFVPWLHEMLFSLASTSTNRNVDVGSPLVLNIPPELKIDQYEFVGPGNRRFPADRIPDELQPGAILTGVNLPGIYRFARKESDGKPAVDDEHFVVNFDRGESDLTILTEAQRTALSGEDRLVFASDLSELQQQMFADSSRTELWWLLIYGFLAMMSVEAWMTRRMLRGATDPVKSGSGAVAQ
ncbi:MAG: VWA domain-containing protein [Planctomycetes bacterium]|nr:VWA domain-containing protein [Planctomycetota bacterium]